MALINTTTTGILGTTVYGDGQGALTVQKDGVTQGILTRQPTFKCYSSTNGTINSATFTKITTDTKVWDSDNCFDNVTNYRFTPNVAGYYQFNGGLWVASTGSYQMCVIYKNGGMEIRGNEGFTSSYMIYSQVNGLAYANGTTDYFEFYGYQEVGTSRTWNGSPTTTWWSGILVKAV